MNKGLLGKTKLGTLRKGEQVSVAGTRAARNGMAGVRGRNRQSQVTWRPVRTKMRLYTFLLSSMESH